MIRNSPSPPLLFAVQKSQSSPEAALLIENKTIWLFFFSLLFLLCLHRLVPNVMWCCISLLPPCFLLTRVKSIRKNLVSDSSGALTCQLFFFLRLLTHLATKRQGTCRVRLLSYPDHIMTKQRQRLLVLSCSTLQEVISANRENTRRAENDCHFGTRNSRDPFLFCFFTLCGLVHGVCVCVWVCKPHLLAVQICTYSSDVGFFFFFFWC